MDDNTQTFAPTTTNPQRTKPATEVCRTFMQALNQRRIELYMPFEALSEFSGVADRYLAKAVHCHKPSGRQPTWATLQILCDTLYPDGLSIKIIPHSGPELERLLAEFRRRYPARGCAAKKSRRGAQS